MRHLGLVLGFIAVLTSCHHREKKPETPVYPQVKKAAELPVEIFFKNPAMYSYRISPDGKWLAVLKPWKNRLNIFVHPTNKPELLTQISSVETRDIQGFWWKGSDRLLFALDQNGDENRHVWQVDLKITTNGSLEASAPKDVAPLNGTRVQLVDLLEESAPHDVLLQHNQRDKEVFDLYRLNLTSGQLTLVKKNDQHYMSWLVDHAGHVRGALSSDGVTSVLFFEKRAGRPWTPVFKTNFRITLNPIAFTADNKRLFASTNFNRDLDAIVEMDPYREANQIIRRVIYTHPKYDVAGAAYSEKRKTLALVNVVTDRHEVRFLNPADQADWNYLKAQFPKAGGLAFASASRDERFWVVKTESDRTLGNYYVFDRTNRLVSDLGNTSPWFDPELMAPMQTVHYTTRDGLQIEGYLTLPRGTTDKHLPLVVNPHGGPWHRDVWGFNEEAQFLASRGYAVFQMNFRGSTGYGRKFWEKSFKQWGKDMQNDITDGVNWLVSQGIANPKQICIYGASYGGYATLAGLAYTPDLYACGVDYVGVSNIFTLLKTIPPYWRPMLEQMYEMIGDPEKDKDLLRAVSPVFSADKIKAPLFIAQGANDPRVNKAESDQIVEALRKRGMEVDYMVKENEGHGFRNEENRFDFYRAMEKFLAKYLGARS